jgi:hypothetical protein
VSSTNFLNAKELQSIDPKRFQKEYSEWTNYALDYDWWDYMEDGFKEDAACEGVEIKRIYFSLSYSQGDYASFEGQINVAEWMLAKGYDETYPALYLAVKDYGEYASVTDRSRGSWPRVNYDGNCAGNTHATGIFKHLDDETWDELVYEQYQASGIEDEMQSAVDAMCRKLYRDLRDECEHLTSEKSFIESCECNDITFEIEECEA